MNRPGAGGANGSGEPWLDRRASTNFLRLADNRMDAEELCALIVGDDTKGRSLAPASLEAEVIKGNVESSPIPGGPRAPVPSSCRSSRDADRVVGR
ncbi:hypothetical protein [Neorhizobium galegae]|uniref:hypothetical protein n=1 Tax=Neorhizobium galegae TaxID=399 RepID=UPI00210598F8|nr:hypothetical protein [Neorhizobium galegae]MCQ1839318.1 hypothetical protein [Neorhizobium galegae]UIY31420.1 hypothetical protein LZK73_30485 [Neorhizobium galegae]